MKSTYLKPSLLIVFFTGLIMASCQHAPTAQVPEKLPDSLQRLAKNALKGLKIDERLYATLFASEPMITNPTNMDIDARATCGFVRDTITAPTSTLAIL